MDNVRQRLYVNDCRERLLLHDLQGKGYAGVVYWVYCVYVVDSTDCSKNVRGRLRLLDLQGKGYASVV